MSLKYSYGRGYLPMIVGRFQYSFRIPTQGCWQVKYSFRIPTQGCRQVPEVQLEDSSGVLAHAPDVQLKDTYLEL
jgi:hypothetical protein